MSVSEALKTEPLASCALASASLLPPLADRLGGLFTLKDAASGRYLHVNAAMATLLRRPADEIVGSTDAELFDAPAATALRAADQTALAQAAPLHSEHKIELQGVRHEFNVTRTCAVEDDGRRVIASFWLDLAPQRAKDQQLRAALEQLEQQQRANRQLRLELQDQTLRDAATGLYNRAHFDDQLKREVDLSTREHREFALVWIALDPLAPNVDALGAAARSSILEAIGRLLRSNTRAMDASCRLDESRFAVLLSGVGLATAHSRMEGLRRQCATQIVMHDGRELGFTVCMGKI